MKLIGTQINSSCCCRYQLCILNAQMVLFFMLPKPSERQMKRILSEELLVACCFAFNNFATAPSSDDQKETTSTTNPFSHVLRWVLDRIDVCTAEPSSMENKAKTEDLKEKFDVNAMIENRRLLSFAVIENNNDIVSFLLRNNVDPTLTDADGTSVLYHCVTPGREHLLEIILCKWNPLPIPTKYVFEHLNRIDHGSDNNNNNNNNAQENHETVIAKINRLRSFKAYRTLAPFVEDSDSLRQRILT